MMSSAKTIIRTLLGKTGYAIVRIKPQARKLPVFYSVAEIKELEDDLDKLRTTGKDFNGWDSRAKVRTYLTNDRINFYHELIEICVKRGVDFSRGRILDSGTCTGYLLRVLEKRVPGGRLYGCDYQTMFVNLASALVPAAQIFKGNILQPTSSIRYDVIFCTEVLEHVRDTETPIPTLLNLLEDFGTLVLTVPNGRYDCSPAESLFEDGISYAGHVNFWSPESWEFYIQRLCHPFRTITGTLDGEMKLFAIIKVERDRVAKTN